MAALLLLGYPKPGLAGKRDFLERRRGEHGRNVRSRGTLIKQRKSEPKTASAGQGSVELADLKHVAIIMDGNRRWADKRHLPRLVGHREGVQSLKRLVKHVAKRKLGYMTVYAFSSENWQRTREEVDYLMDLFAKVLTDELEELLQANVRLTFIGDLVGMPEGLQGNLQRAMKHTSENDGLNLQVALNYGSRAELTEAVKNISRAVVDGKITVDEITPELISANLYTRDIPDPDLIIRTGGDMRLSNYLLWQAAYTELYVTNVLWPEFDAREFDRAVEEFSKRQRRFGG